MDFLTFLMSQGASEEEAAAALAEAKSYTDTALSAAKKYTDDVQDLDLFDQKIYFGLLLNYVRAKEEEWASKGFTVQHGTKTLTNTQPFPFNDSKQTVALSPALPDTTYAVITQILSSTGPAGEVDVSDKLVNGFKLNTTGSASSVVVDYIVIGGFTT